MKCSYRSKLYKKRTQTIEYDEEMIYKPKNDKLDVLKNKTY